MHLQSSHPHCPMHSRSSLHFCSRHLRYLRRSFRLHPPPYSLHRSFPSPTHALRSFPLEHHHPAPAVQSPTQKNRSASSPPEATPTTSPTPPHASEHRAAPN